jgi:hypothetical protein
MSQHGLLKIVFLPTQKLAWHFSDEGFRGNRKKNVVKYLTEKKAKQL